MKKKALKGLAECCDIPVAIAIGQLIKYTPGNHMESIYCRILDKISWFVLLLRVMGPSLSQAFQSCDCSTPQSLFLLSLQKMPVRDCRLWSLICPQLDHGCTWTFFEQRFGLMMRLFIINLCVYVTLVQLHVHLNKNCSYGKIFQQ